MDEDNRGKDEDNRGKIVKKDSSEETLAEVKEKLEIEELKREHFIKKINDYSNLITTKVLGLGSLIIGVSELLGLSSIGLAPPLTPFFLISVSMAFLLNKRAISVMRMFLKVLTDSEEGNK